MNEHLTEKLALLPEDPGVYLMKNAAGELLYVGKAKNLKNRVRSYFRSPHDHDPKTKELVARIATFDYMVTDTENEAFVLEGILIERHQPKYNIRIPDNKHFLYIGIDTKDQYPYLSAEYRTGKEGMHYFGPYRNSAAVRNLISVINKVFRLRSCRQSLEKKKSRACLNYHLGLCSGPCIRAISSEDYAKQLEQAKEYLGGDEKKIIASLEEQMLNAAKDQDFERAARLRDMIGNLRGVATKEKLASGKENDADIIALARGIEDVCVMILFMREGQITGREAHMMINSYEERTEDVLSAFLSQYYAVEDAEIPEEILLDGMPSEAEWIEEWLTEKKGRKVVLTYPQRGPKKQLTLLARKNALLQVEEHWHKRSFRDDVRLETLDELAHFLHLSVRPRRIECFDISNIQGSDSVGSMAVFTDGRADKQQYRRFKIRSVSGPDDYASLREVLGRRISNFTSDDESFKKIPDLIIIDGGLGQLSAVAGIMKELNVRGISLISLAEREEWVYLPESSKPVILPKNSRSLHLLQRIRDEAHRFAVTYHRKLRSKRAVKTVLRDIPGIGERREKELLKKFKTIKRVSAASVEELAKVPGMNNAAAQAVYDFFQQESE